MPEQTGPVTGEMIAIALNDEENEYGEDSIPNYSRVAAHINTMLAAQAGGGMGYVSIVDLERVMNSKCQLEQGQNRLSYAVGILAMREAIRSLFQLASTPAKPETLHIIFDGPPSHESGRFIEVETPDGRSVNAGEWVQRPDGLWALIINSTPAKPPLVFTAEDFIGYGSTSPDAAAYVVNRCIAEYYGAEVETYVVNRCIAEYYGAEADLQQPAASARLAALYDAYRLTVNATIKDDTAQMPANQWRILAAAIEAVVWLKHVQQGESVTVLWKRAGKNPRYMPSDLESAFGYLVEECGEVLAAVGKTTRWGPNSRNPELAMPGETNLEWILREIPDLELAIKIFRIITARRKKWLAK